MVSLHDVLLAVFGITVNFLNIRTSKKFAVITLKVEQDGVSLVMHPKDAEGIANSVDPDQTAPLGAV